MTTMQALVHPLITKCADDLKSRLIALQVKEGESVLMVRIVVRNGVPRKVKWIKESEEILC